MTKKDQLPTYDESEQGLDRDLNVISDEQRARSARAVCQLSARQAFLNHIGKVDGDQKPTALANLFGQHLSAADTGPLRIAIYLRVSTEEQAKVGGTAEGYSIPYQRRVCTEKAEQMGGVIVEVYVELGLSAKSTKRPEFQRMMREIRPKGIQCVIVHKIDRLARNSKDAHNVQADIMAKGASLVSVMEYIDDSPAGRLNYAIQAGVAQYHSDNLKLEVLKGMTTKASQGGTPYRAPLGYLNKQEIVDNIVVRSIIVDDVRAPLIRWAFTEYATGGWTLLTLTEALTEKGLLTRKTPKVSSKPLTSGALYNLLRNPYYMGVLPYRGVYYDGTHAPLVDVETWLRVQDVLAAHNTAGEKDRRHPHYLKGSVWCSDCGSRFVFSRNTGWGGSYDYFICMGRKRKENRCSRTSVRVEAVEAGVERYYNVFQLHPDGAARIRDTVRSELEAERAQALEDEKRAARQVAVLKDERKALLQAHYAKAVPTDLLREEMDRLTRAIAEAEAETVKAARTIEQLAETLELALYVASTCQEQYHVAPPRIRRQINQGFFTKLFISNDGSVERAAMTEPFAQLLAADVAAQLAPQAAPNNINLDCPALSAQPASTAGSVQSDGFHKALTSMFAGSEDEDEVASNADYLSVNKQVLVPPPRLERGAPP